MLLQHTPNLQRQLHKDVKEQEHWWSFGLSTKYKSLRSKPGIICSTSRVTYAQKAGLEGSQAGICRCAELAGQLLFLELASAYMHVWVYLLDGAYVGEGSS